MNRTFTKVITLTGFVLLIGVFIYYRLDGFETTAPVMLTSNQSGAADTTRPQNTDSLLLEEIIDSLSYIRMVSSKSIVVLKDVKSEFRKDLLSDTVRLRKLLDKQKARQLTRSQSVNIPTKSAGTKRDTTNQHN
ncbi:hypothetical protein [Paraflavitalea sp. CAU 1676]|uniref:hypothetical protein n=1 Tax=Paraflavitalea sp. CAU 1676 TaxID=3032598 RepID=UPI0023DB5BE4|nr:hypothetical protein [Paraflavitalea sp. CAU 1676]MDF2189062.1 hypothetical protein [Paraflavitalea sp. CAU 1676]